ncbi:hypothetical protein V8C86DRAFT_2566672 [Haematococcus lacustris]
MHTRVLRTALLHHLRLLLCGLLALRFASGSLVPSHTRVAATGGAWPLRRLLGVVVPEPWPVRRLLGVMELQNGVEGQPSPSRQASAPLRQAQAQALEAAALAAGQQAHLQRLRQLLLLQAPASPSGPAAPEPGSAPEVSPSGPAAAGRSSTLSTGERSLQIGGRNCTCAYVSQFYCQPSQQATGGPEGLFCCCS